MNCLYITLFFNTVAGIAQTFNKSWNQLLCPRDLEVCRLPFKPRRDFFLYLIIFVELFLSDLFNNNNNNNNNNIYLTAVGLSPGGSGC
jgi:hypothetical protein